MIDIKEDYFSNQMLNILQRVYNHNKLLAYDMIVMVNQIKGTNFIIKDTIVYDYTNY